jgi:hypothetical protein
MSPEREAFVREAASKQTQYERDRRKTSDYVMGFYRAKFGEPVK